MLDRATLQGRHFVVWGLGKQGLAAALYLVRQGAAVSVVEQRTREQAASAVESLAPWKEQVHYYWEGELPNRWEGIDRVVLSPGVPYDSPPLVALREQGVSTVAALDVAIQCTDVPAVAVTGSAGKSTTVSLLGAMLKASGLSSFVGGNLGTPLFSWLNEEQPAERLVLECSSFQLEACTHLRPQVAVLTNLGENHLDRHKTMESYADCKANLFRFMDSEAYVVARANDDWVSKVIAETPAQVVYFHPEGEAGVGAMTMGDSLVLRHPSWGEEVIPWSSLRLRGGHNRENAMAAALAARLSGATAAGIAQGMQDFSGLPHRLEDVGVVDGVHYFNDSKATTPDAAVRSMQAFGPDDCLHVLLGGRSKGNRFVAINQAVQEGRTRLYLFGEAAATIANDLHSSALWSKYPTMKEACEAAKQAASSGDVVLLSPACASFDEFANFEERGRVFREWVLRFGEEVHV
ncbi:MAG: UDP-N-acetylmuramoyl-L-alanine--D-glutamate ligase [Deltaproteobacteria bacterium]|nr:MAG: UDP-N-acetylmuramoyl-L-alanine--D-glutamate ligase [Deltaproteobacteria bacterium]